MKKFIYSMFALAISAMTFTSCEDVPAPYALPGNEDPVVIEPTGSGTLEDPYNVAAALDYVNGLAADAESPQDIYIKGKVVSVNTNYNESEPQFGNAVFYISDDGTSAKQFYVYRALYLGNKKYTSGTTLAKGDEVIICGKVVNYKGTTPETVQSKAFLYSRKGVTEGGGSGDAVEGKGSGTLDDPFNPVGATKYASSLPADQDSEKDIYVKGKISRIDTDKNGVAQNFDNGTFGNASFYISEDGSENGEFYVFRTLYLGNKKWVAGAGDIVKVGDEVIVCGKVVNYKGNTPETSANKSFLYSLNGKTKRDDDGGGGSGGGETGDVKAVTIAAFNAAEESNSQVYELVGTIGGSINTTYGNFDLTDETGTVYVYGLTATNLGYGAQNDKSYSSLKLAAGDKIKIRGYRGSYGDKIEVMYAWFVEKLADGGGGGSEGGGEAAETGDNGTFESWADGVPTNWKTASTAGNAKLAQSTDAHGGSYSVKVSGDTGANKRLGYKEMKLKAGTYKVVFYAKALAEGGSLNPGIVPMKADGSAGSYKYSGYVDNVSTSEWQKVEADITVDSDGIYCFVIMNQKKSPAVDILIDDFTVTLGSTTIIK